MIDVQRPKELRKHYHFIDDIIPIVMRLYDRKFRLSRLSRKNAEQRGHALESWHVEKTKTR